MNSVYTDQMHGLTGTWTIPESKNNIKQGQQIHVITYLRRPIAKEKTNGNYSNYGKVGNPIHPVNEKKCIQKR